MSLIMIIVISKDYHSFLIHFSNRINLFYSWFFYIIFNLTIYIRAHLIYLFPGNKNDYQSIPIMQIIVS